MHEKIEMKTHTLAVAATAGWPMALALAVLALITLVIAPASLTWAMLLALVVTIGLTFLWCLRMYLGTYIFLPATEFQGARIIARLGRNEDVVISGVLQSEIIVKQGWIEKLCGVCHIRQKGTAIYLRGVKDMEAVQAWISANFPAERKAVRAKGKKRR